VYKPDKTVIDETPEKEESGASSPRHIDIEIEEPEAEKPDQIKLPIIRRSTQVKDILSHDIYIKNSKSDQTGQSNHNGINGHNRTLNTYSSVQNLTVKRDGVSSRMSKESKYSSMHSHTKSNASIFKERYDKNIESYLSALEMKHVGRKNVSDNMSKLMSPNYAATKSRDFEL